VDCLQTTSTGTLKINFEVVANHQHFVGRSAERGKHDVVKTPRTFSAQMICGHEYMFEMMIESMEAQEPS
jgi:hypothetical protein